MSYHSENRCGGCDRLIGTSTHWACKACEDAEQLPLLAGLAELRAGTLGLTDVRRDRDGRTGG